MTTLYYLTGSCSLVPHIVARELQLDVKLQLAPRNGEDGREEYLKNVNALGSVPALQLDNGSVITQNVAIVEYMASLGEQAGKVGVVYPKLGSREHAEALRWLAYANADLHPAFKPLFRPAIYTKNEAMHAEIKQNAMIRLMDMYKFVDRQYINKDWIANNHYSAADIYLYVSLRWARSLGLDLSSFASLQKMIAKIQARPALILALKEQGIALLD